MAAVTMRLHFSAGVYVLPPRNPFGVARAMGTLTIFTGSRFMLGVGAGWTKGGFDIYGIEFYNQGKR